MTDSEQTEQARRLPSPVCICIASRDPRCESDIHVARQADEQTFPVRAPHGHRWFPPVKNSAGEVGLAGRCECGSEYDVQTWATHVSLVREMQVRDFIDRWRGRLAGFVAGVVLTLLCQVVSANV